MKRRKYRRKIKGIPFFAGVFLTTGIVVFMYPILSSYLAKRQQENIIVGYENTLANMNVRSLKKEWGLAENYDGRLENYEKVLNVEGKGIMGYIEIPKIDTRLPIYHYANDESLKKGVGHLEQSSLPIGRKGSHSVLTGHRGLPNAELFTRLDEMEEKDIFYLHILDKTFTYEVKKVKIVLPKEIQQLKTDPFKDIVTLVTCTPYGINTHRLLVIGERIENTDIIEQEQEKNMKEKSKVLIYCIVLAAGILIVLYPQVTKKFYENKIKNNKILFVEEREKKEFQSERLYKVLNQQNKRLYQSRQKNLCDEQSYKNANVNLEEYGITDNTIGYISIPKMKIILPVLLGANEENMKKGAVHLTQTSYPIGGKNTNCVIAAHRGYSRAPMFREIEKLKRGNKIYLENFKEKLTYKVIKTKVISPTDIEEIMMREDKDMLTLITCHPYRKNSQRYVVFCERI